ncbi:beta-monoglucosyl diacylglycerol synthase [Pleomorphomonas sp. SM30]|nr:beta-monoglucosyl diacylglycerol synthase [Pleomorphomonas sp. SM30]GLS76794.1 hypothetical protein GCM10007904_21310 [Oharaeibacter diazotrophicus]
MHLLDTVAVPLPLAVAGTSDRGRRTLIALAPEIAAAAEIAALIAREPRLAGRVLVDPALAGAAKAWDPGPFGPDAVVRAAREADPVAVLARGRPDGEDVLAALAAERAGLPFVRVDEVAEIEAPAGLRPRMAAGLGAARVRIGGARRTAVAFGPGDDPARLRLDGAATARPVVVTTRRRLERALRAAIAATVIAETTGRLERLDPALSAARIPSRPQATALLGGAALLLLGAFDLLPGAGLAVFAISAFAFLGCGWVRLLATVEAPPPRSVAPLADDELPAYTVLAALHREEAMVETLVAALAALDYPPARREVVLVIEAGDAGTLAAAERAVAGRRGFRVVAVPDGRPRTKPRALAYALAFSRGDLVTVYDAEDRPDPGQLRAAAAAFARGPDHLACVQARLVIDRTEVALQRLFAIEYACLFDGLLPWLGHNRLPLPLGGTSNHFKRVALDACGGWDPWNVTEDADLGLRLARFGFTADVVDSFTREEAPARLSVWLPQRVRWIKGWVATWLVAMRRPATLYREIGPGGFAALQVHFAATVLAGLLHPAGLILVGLHLSGLRSFDADRGFLGDVVVVAAATGVVAGYAGNVALALAVLRRTERRHLVPWAFALPLYWLLTSAASWTALVDLVRRPHFWAKTPHTAFEARKGRKGKGKRRKRRRG